MIHNLGSLNLDHVYQLPRFVKAGETLSVPEYQRFVGGKGLNQSVALARAGAMVKHIGKVGADGEILLQALEASGVDISQVQQESALSSGHAVIQVNAEGENCILVFGGSNQKIHREEIVSALSHAEPGHLALTQNETNEVPFLIEEAKRKGCLIAFNPAPFTSEVRDYPLELLDFLILNESELLELCPGDMDNEQRIQCLSDRHANLTIVLTLGKQGALLRRGEEVLYQEGFSVEAVDTTAAGDTFIGYFLAAKMENRSNDDALRLGCKAASITVQRHGASPSIPMRHELES